MDWILSFTNLKAFSFSWLLLKWNYLTWCHPKWCDPWSFTAFLFPSLSPSPLCISKATLFVLSDIPYISEFSLLLPKELFFIVKTQFRWWYSSVKPFSVPVPSLTVYYPLFWLFLCLEHTLTTFIRYVVIFCLFIFVSLESNVFTCAIVFSKY